MNVPSGIPLPYTSPFLWQNPVIWSWSDWNSPVWNRNIERMKLWHLRDAQALPKDRRN